MGDLCFLNIFLVHSGLCVLLCVFAFFVFLDYFPSPTRILHEIQLQLLLQQRLQQNSSNNHTHPDQLIINKLQQEQQQKQQQIVRPTSTETTKMQLQHQESSTSSVTKTPTRTPSVYLTNFLGIFVFSSFPVFCIWGCS